jgi:hypothetical protein
MNKLYLVSSNNRCRTGKGYDTFDSFVVCCKTEQDARETYPDGRKFKDIHEQDKRCTWSSWIHEEEIPLLDVVFLGIAEAGAEEGVILASFNAG